MRAQEQEQHAVLQVRQEAAQMWHTSSSTVHMLEFVVVRFRSGFEMVEQELSASVSQHQNVGQVLIEIRQQARDYQHRLEERCRGFVELSLIHI